MNKPNKTKHLDTEMLLKVKGWESKMGKGGQLYGDRQKLNSWW